MVSKSVAFVLHVIVMLLCFMWRQYKSPIAVSILAAFRCQFQPLVDVVTVAAVVGSAASVLSCFCLGLVFASVPILHCCILVALSLALLPSHFPGRCHTLLTSLAYFGLPTKHEIQGTTNNFPYAQFLGCCYTSKHFFILAFQLLYFSFWNSSLEAQVCLS